MEEWKVGVITLFSVLGGILVVGALAEIKLRLTAAKFAVKGKHCYVTGGSQGLGKAVAIDLARRGANVTIVARREDVLKDALKEIKDAAASKEQSFIYVTADCGDHKSSVDAIDEAVEKQKAPVEYLFCCAGVSIPGEFLEQDMAKFQQVMQVNYFGALYTAHEVAKQMVDRQLKGGHIVFVSSTLGFFGLVGYSTYAPTKFAIRGLAETLRTELQANGINIHCYFPGTIFSPGYETESLTKPAITKQIEGADEGLQPEQCSAGLFKGLARGEFAICTDPISLIFRCSTRGVMPNNNVVLDTFIAGLGWIAFIPWRWYVDHIVKSSFRAGKEKKD